MNEHKIDWKNENYKDHAIYLFFDLLQVSRDILQITSPDDIIILIGNIPSYLRIFLKDRRKTFNLPFSKKPFGCFWEPFGKTEVVSCWIKDTWVPTPFELQSFFAYLETTKLTREFIKEKWFNIILIDSSMGQSIHGASIMFNHYVGNIISHPDPECKLIIDCADITGAQPLRFINLNHNHPLYNIKSDMVERVFAKNPDSYNFLPDLIIPIQSVDFLYEYGFLRFEWFPRFVPFYDIRRWGNSASAGPKLDPYFDPKQSEELSKDQSKNILGPSKINEKSMRAYKNLRKKFRYLLKQYSNRKTQLNETQKIKCTKIIGKLTKNLSSLKQYITDNPIKTMDNINLIVLVYKHLHIFDEDEDEYVL